MVDEELKTETATVRMTRKLKNELEAFARADRRKLAPFIEIILEDYVQAQKKEKRR